MLRTSLATAALEDNPTYEALSYVWGTHTKEKVEITVDGYCFFIAPNLAHALKALRHPTLTRVLWVDAICIDLPNNDERSHQVMMMQHIYKTATSTLVYLGEPTEHTETDMQHLQAFIQPYAQGKEAPWSHIAIPNLERSINNILTRPWFERMWTIQEAVLARKTTLQCGSHRVQWAGDLRTLRALVFRIKSAVISPMYDLHNNTKTDWTPLLYILESQMRQAARREGVVLQRNLLDIAFDYRYRKCGEPRDRYFAVLGIIEDDRGGLMCFEPDYDISLEDLHRTFTAEIQRISEIEDAPLEEFRAVDPSSLPKCLGVDPSPFPRLGEPWIGSFTPICMSALNDTG